jgi:glycosyltransferase involved in cell wall biosynthesis
MIGRRDTKTPTFFLWVGGPIDCPCFTEIWHDVQKAGLGRVVRFVGTQPIPLEYFSTLDVFALTSREDPFPLVMLECASLGIPIVCFDGAGGAKEFVEEDCGFVVPYLEMETLADRAVALLEQPDLRRMLGGRAKEKVRQRCDISLVAPKILNVIERFYVP